MIILSFVPVYGDSVAEPLGLNYWLVIFYVLSPLVADAAKFNTLCDELSVIMRKRNVSLKEALKLTGKDRRTLYRFRYVHRLRVTNRDLFQTVSTIVNLSNTFQAPNIETQHCVIKLSPVFINVEFCVDSHGCHFLLCRSNTTSEGNRWRSWTRGARIWWMLVTSKRRKPKAGW